MKQSVDHVRGVALGALKSVTSAAIPEVSDLTEAVRRFKDVEFDIPADVGTDGFLFQYGTVDRLAEPTFVLGFTRQLGVGEDGAVEFVQVQFEYHYQDDAELSQLESPDSWWFRDDETSFVDWLDATLRDPVWDVIRKKNPVAFDVTKDFV